MLNIKIFAWKPSGSLGLLVISCLFSLLLLVQSPSPTLWDPMDCSMPGLPVAHHVPEFAQVHVHCISDAIQPPHPLSPSSPLPAWCPANKSCTFLHHNPMWVDWLCCMSGKWTQVQFSNNFTKGEKKKKTHKNQSECELHNNLILFTFWTQTLTYECLGQYHFL